MNLDVYRNTVFLYIWLRLAYFSVTLPNIAFALALPS